MQLSNTQKRLTLSCQCKEFSARLNLDAHRRYTRLVCYCRDCQAFAHHLKAADSQLDEFGGTDAVQLSPAAIDFHKGIDNLAVLRLSEGGVLRWYASCCNTAIGVTLTNSELPYLALAHGGLIKGKDRETLQSIVGDIQFGLNAGRQYPLETNWPVSKGFGWRSILATTRNIGRWKMSGDHKRSAFFGSNGEPVITPTILSDDERSAARAQCPVLEREN